jgi:hypothetical protein
LTTGSEALHAHDQADFLWRQLKRFKPAERIVLVEEERRYQRWGLAVLIGWAILAAQPLLDTGREPRLALSVFPNLVINLLDLGRAEEARQKLPEVRRLAARLGGELDLTRVVWMEALVAEALGDLGEARTRSEEVRRAFDKPELIYDHALVSLDLACAPSRSRCSRSSRANRSTGRRSPPSGCSVKRQGRQPPRWSWRSR